MWTVLQQEPGRAFTARALAQALARPLHEVNKELYEALHQRQIVCDTTHLTPRWYVPAPDSTTTSSVAIPPTAHDLSRSMVIVHLYAVPEGDPLLEFLVLYQRQYGVKVLVLVTRHVTQVPTELAVDPVIKRLNPSWGLKDGVQDLMHLHTMRLVGEWLPQMERVYVVTQKGLFSYYCDKLSGWEGRVQVVSNWAELRDFIE